jgi:hypothetical protein
MAMPEPAEERILHLTGVNPPGVQETGFPAGL